MSSAVTLEPTAFQALPGWAHDDHAAAFAAFKRSAGVTVARAGDERSKRLFAHVEGVAKSISAAEAKAFFEQHFVPHYVRHEAAQGLLTGYYEPLLHGSRTPDERFTIPLLRRPADLVTVVDDSLRANPGHPLTHMRARDGHLEPYPTRREIETGALAGSGLELVYLTDPVDAFFLHVQGSGRIALPDGTSIRVTYDGKNGHPYASVGRYVIDSGFVPADDLTLDVLGDWLRVDAERGRQAMWHNASYVFFRELAPGEDGPLGVQGIPLTAGRSLAVDASLHPLGHPIYVVSPTLKLDGSDAGFQRLMIAQDVGSAIRGPERGDIFYGCGSEAGRQAGRTKHAGNFFVLLPA